MIRKNAVYLFSKRQKDLCTVSGKIKLAQSISLFLDYDGTLTPIRKTPSEAKLPAPAKNILTVLSALPDVNVSIVTGRSMADIRRLVPLRNIIFAANHGLHIRYGKEEEWVHVSALASRHTLKTVRTKLRRAVKNFAGAFVENKDLTLSVHYRNCLPGRVPALKNVITNIVYSTDPLLRITKGKKVLEIRPPTTWGKSGAVMELLAASPAAEGRLAIYIGDDTTDEEAFITLGQSGVTVHVGKRMNTAASYYVKDVQEVLDLLRLVLMLRMSDTRNRLRQH